MNVALVEVGVTTMMRPFGAAVHGQTDTIDYTCLSLGAVRGGFAGTYLLHLAAMASPPSDPPQDAGQRTPGTTYCSVAQVIDPRLGEMPRGGPPCNGLS